jgi:hypothetical protein
MPHPYPPLAAHLEYYEFECIGTFWESSFDPEAVVYAFVARMGIELYDYVLRPGDHRWRRTQLSQVQILTSEVFYIGSTESLSVRIGCHQVEADKAPRPPGIGRRSLLSEARKQGLPVDVYVRRVPDRFIIINGLPIDLLRGAEAGLIRELSPRTNIRR